MTEKSLILIEESCQKYVASNLYLTKIILLIVPADRTSKKQVGN
jgi:hypothetical protein